MKTKRYLLVLPMSMIAVLLMPFYSIANPPPNVNISNNGWYQNEPMVAIKPTDHNKLVAGFNDARNAGSYGVGWAWSDNGGTNWNYGGKFSFSGYSLGADPVVAFDNTGTAYMVGLAYNPDSSPSILGRDGSIFIAKSNDGGHTFTVFQTIIATGKGTETHYDKPWLYINQANNHIYVAWVKRTNAWGTGGTESMVIEFTRSTNGGVNFSTPVQVSAFSSATGTNRSHGPQITAVSANQVYVAWHTLEAGTLPNPPTTPWKIWIAGSNNGGASFGTNNLAVTSVWGYPIRFISMDADPNTGKIYIAYADSTVQTPRDYDVFVTSATSAAGPWSAPVRVNDDPQNGRWQFFPALDVAPNGRVDVIWYDYRDNPNLINVYSTYSTDGGTTWATNSKLTDINGATPESGFAGDYNTVASVDERAYFAWMDKRTNTQEIYGASVVRAPAVVLLFDTSGSMSWSHAGVTNVPVDQQRLTLAKRAAIPFMEMIQDHYLGQVYFGVAGFPWQPWNNSLGCIGQVITPMSLADNANVNNAIKDTPPLGTIPALTANGNTPLLAGVEVAKDLFGAQPKQAIVLLSDGYHNCPSTVNPTDSTVTTLINQLTTQGVRVYSIGFGRPGEVDPLLAALANNTSGSFYDVTQDTSFDPVNWDPQTALQATYKAILINYLDLQPITDPFGTIKAGQQHSHQSLITSHADKVSFFLSWASATAGQLGLIVRAADGQSVPQSGAGIQRHTGDTHVLLTVDKTFLQQPGKIGDSPWTLEINANDLSTEQVKYQYSVFSASSLKMSPQVKAAKFTTGVNLTLSAAITLAGQPVTGLSEVKVRVNRPSEGLGNWYAAHKVTRAELDKIPMQINTETLPMNFRKARYLIEHRKVAFPARQDAGALQLYDDGTHGDARADDGIYTITYNDTSKEGNYVFHFSAAGSTADGSSFTREGEMHRHLKAVFSLVHSDIKLIDLGSKGGLQNVRVVVTAKDVLGNYLTPGQAGAIQLAVNHGRPIDVVQDKLDGTYTQSIQLPVSVARNAQLKVKLGDMTKTVAWPRPPTGTSDLFNWLTWALVILIIAIVGYVFRMKRA